MSNVVERLEKYSGLDFDKQRTPGNPCITVREAIEVANHIATLTAKLADMTSRYENNLKHNQAHCENNAKLMQQLAEAQRDAERYRWLKAQKGLRLESSGMEWKRDVVIFTASHWLCANNTSHVAYETLDETIDKARSAE